MIRAKMSAIPMEPSTMDKLFPIPSTPWPRRPSITPAFWPGATPKTSEALTKILKENHERWHCFFNREAGYHNHVSHHAIALWALGANEEAIRQAYERDSTYQCPMVESPAEIIHSNWKEHLGDENYYKAYLEFFTKIVQEQGAVSAVEEYIFAADANFNQNGTSPAMLSRFMAAIFHPLSYVGYGLEFGIPGMVVEGLALTAVHKDTSGLVMTPTFFNSCIADVETTSTHTVPTREAEKGQAEKGQEAQHKRSAEKHATFASRIDNLIQKLHLSKPKRRERPDVHALTIMDRILKDPRLDEIKEQEGRPDVYQVYPKLMEKFGEPLKEHARQWNVNVKLGAAGQDGAELDRKLEELAWAYTVMYGLGGWKKGQTFNADFPLAHIVTSAIFLPAIASKLDPACQVLLLRGHFAISLGWWIGRGRPKFNIEEFVNSQDPTAAAVDKATNPWLGIVQEGITHEEEHVSMVQRTLSHWSYLYELKGPKDPQLSATELPDADRLDGSLFLRVAKLTADRVGRPVPSGSEKELAMFRVWDRHGFYSTSQRSSG
ncbi:hypothetical protein AX17_007478 [Amanita inopinata Kibby_2008]|nr:hypothetical protein AX17_007478 [Amanita inopinata Kibby_2008]